MCKNSEIPSDKSALRAWARRRRSETDFETASWAVVNKIKALPAFCASRNVLIYLALAGEVNVEPLLDSAEPGSKRWYVPRCEPGRTLSIHPYFPERTVLRGGPFGIREPDADSRPVRDLGQIDVVIVPGLLFTPHGGRLGHGGGYYDRFLPSLSPSCIRIGVIPYRQMVDELPLDPWDIRVSLVVTELGIARATTPL